MVEKAATQRTVPRPLITMTGHELLQVCAMTKNHEYVYTIPLARVVDKVLEYSVETVRSWEFLDLTLDLAEVVSFRFDLWFSWGETGFEEMVLALRFHNLELGHTEELKIDIIRVILNELQGKSRKLYIQGAEISAGQNSLQVGGKDISLKDGTVRVLITTEKPFDRV